MFLLCFKIFFARVLDVSLGTFRTLVTVKGNYKDASIIGFFEVLIWFLIVKEAINTDSSSILIGISYAFGFATGTYVGGIISAHFIKGNYTVQVIRATTAARSARRNSKRAFLVFSEIGFIC